MQTALLLLTGSAEAPLAHQLDRVLHLLHVAALILAALLAVIVLCAVWIYRRNRSKSLPKGVPS